MNERRRFRRSSPDAPQGTVAVLTVFAGLVAVVVVAGIGFVGAGGSTSKQSPDASVAPQNAAGDQAPTSVAPSTTVIRGADATTLFVTTTTPITTTTSTTTTTLPGPPLDPGGPEVVFGPGVLSVSFTVRSSSPEGIAFLVTGVPDGMTATPMQATVDQATPVTITLTIVDQNRARGGTIVLAGSDGSRVPVRVTIQSRAVSVTAVSFDPNPPVCNRSARLVASISGSGVTSVTATVTGGPTLALAQGPNGTWSAPVPVGSAGSSISGTVVATDATGMTASRNFATVVARGPGC